jgi:hypothetical protein
MNDHKHLSGREFERFLEAVNRSQKETRDRNLVVLSWAGLGGQRLGVGAGGRREPHPPRRPPLGGLSNTHPLRGDELPPHQDLKWLCGH